MFLSDLPEFQKNILNWYDINKRILPWRASKDPYRVFVSEVMLQQTRVDTVISYFKRFITRFPTIAVLSSASLEEILKVWEGLGYYSRARNLHQVAQTIVNKYSGRFPSDYASIRLLPGVGKYIAAAFLSISFDLPLAAVDGNVKRVISRLFTIDAYINDAHLEKLFNDQADALLEKSRPGDFNQSMMELGAVICTPVKPLCQVCPVSRHCKAQRDGSTCDYPKKKKRPGVPTYEVAVGVVRRRGKILITKRKEKGLLGGMWEFPGGKLRDGETPERACIRELFEEVGLHVSVGTHIATIRHGYTHFKIQMHVYNCESKTGKVVLNGPVDFKWVRPDELERFPFPAANLKFLNMIS